MPRWATISWIILAEIHKSRRFSRLTSPEVGFHNRIHQSFLHPGIAPENLRFEGELPELRFPEDRLAIPGLEGSVFVTVPMRLPHIDAFIWSGSRLLEGLLEHRLVEELGDEIFHAVLLTVHWKCTSDMPRNVTSAR